MLIGRMRKTNKHGRRVAVPIGHMCVSDEHRGRASVLIGRMRKANKHRTVPMVVGTRRYEHSLPVYMAETDIKNDIQKCRRHLSSL